MRERRQLCAGISLAILALVISVATAEILTRHLLPEDYLRVGCCGPEERRLSPAEFADSTAGFVLLHRRSAVPGLVYELAPGQSRTSDGIRYSTNSLGMRDGEPLPPEDRSMDRVVVIGDSFTFGFRVKGIDSFPSQLEQRLNENRSDRLIDVLNFGVNGYSARDEVLVLEHKGLEWRPDLIIVGYVLNDPETDPVQPAHRRFGEPSYWQRFNLLRMAAKVKNSWDIRRRGDGDYFKYLHAPGYPKWESVIDSFSRIEHLANDQGVPVLLVVFPQNPTGAWRDYPYLEIHRQVAREAANHGFAVIDMLGEFSKYPPRSVRVRRHDGHPSRYGHKLTAQAIYDWMHENSELIGAAS